jgi:hypothetical protein
MMYLKQSTASQSVLIGPFVDATDGATAETALTIANTDIRLSANGGNLAAKNSGGGTHDEAGWYTITLDATDTATVGRLQLHCKVAGALMVHMEFQVLEEAVYDALIGASALGYVANAPVNVAQLSGDATAADNAEAFFDGTGYAGTNNVIPTVTTLTGHTAQTGDAYARLGAPAGASVSADVAAVKSDTAAVLLDTGTDGVVVAAASKTGYSLTATTGLGDQTANITGNLSGSVGSVTGHTAQTGDTYALANGATGFVAIDTVVDAIKVVTDALTAAAATKLAASTSGMISSSFTAMAIAPAASDTYVIL